MNLESVPFNGVAVSNSPTIRYSMLENYPKTCSNSPKESKCKSQILHKPSDQIPDHQRPPTLFCTENGYCGGKILQKYKNEPYMKVLITRDEYGNNVCESCILPISAKVFPKRYVTHTVNLYTIPTKKSGKITAYNYIKANGVIDTGDGLGAGVVGQYKPPKEQKCKMTKYPIHSALTLHNSPHKEMLSNASSFISQMVDEYLQNGYISDPIVEQTCWLLNVVLYVDAHPLINNEVLRETISNFCYDYKHLPSGTLLCQPINYIYNAIAIDGIWSKFGACMSHIPTNFEGIQYKTI